MTGAPSRRGRVLFLAAVLLLTATGYAALLRQFGMQARVAEHHFGTLAPDEVPQLGVYIEVLNVDAVSESARLRISFTPGREMRGRRLSPPRQDVGLQINDGDTVHELTFQAHDPMVASVIEADLYDGTVAAYPFDRFRASLRLAAHEGIAAPGESSRLLPLRVTVWEGIAGWVVEAAQEPGADESGVDEPGAEANEMRLRLSMHRPGALTFLVVAIYGEMALIASAALTIGVLSFLRVRSPESTLISALGSMLFALPALRYTLPGAPPLGIRADLLVFLWAEVGVALGLALFVLAWARGRTRG